MTSTREKVRSRQMETMKIKKANEECESCIHAPVCAYKEHYEDAVKLYKAAIDEAGKYPWFKVDIHCVQYTMHYPSIVERKPADEVAQKARGNEWT